MESLSPTGLALAYSAVYNGIYMVPEIIFTMAAAWILARIPSVVRKVS